MIRFQIFRTIFVNVRKGWFLPLCFMIGLPSILWAQGLTSITVSTANSTVAASTSYDFTFTTTNVLPSDGKLVFDIPAGFNVSSVTAASSTITGLDPVIVIVGNTVTVNRDGLSGDIAGGQDLDLTLVTVVNPTVAGTTYSVDIETQNNSGGTIDSGTSPFFAVTPGALAYFQISGEPVSRWAGQPFDGSITVTAFDTYSNIKTNYTGNVYFTSTDPQAQLPYIQTNMYTFTSGDNGTHNFPGAGFQLRTVGLWNITVTDGTISRQSGDINVTPGPLSRFTISGEPASRLAGQEFTSAMTVIAYDAYNNLKTDYTGQVYFESGDGQARLPHTQSSRYTFTTGGGNDNGIHNFPGSGFELRTVGSWNIRVTDGIINQPSGAVTVMPGPLARFTLSGEPSAIETGQQFSNAITVKAYDNYNNVKTDYTGGVYFTSTDAQAQLFYHQGFPYQFTPGENGTHNFPGIGFVLKTTGPQTISVHDGLVNKASNIITVTASTISEFNLNCGTTQTAGIPFLLIVSGARDQYGNDWSGEVTVTAWPGGGNSPNGISPSFGPIQVIEGSGQAYQALVNAESGVTIRGQAGSLIQTVTGITVNANVLSSLKIRDASNGGGNEIVTLTVNVDETLSLYSAGYDAYGNYRRDELTNWTSSGLIPEVLAFSRSTIQFTPEAPGNGIISAIDPSSTISDHTGTITVNPGAVTHFDIGVINTQVVGQPFTVTVIALDAQNNTARSFTGTVQISDLTGTIIPSTSDNFIDGVWNHGVNIFQEYTSNIITVIDTSSGSTGSSNAFDVVAAPGIRIIQFDPVQADTASYLQTVTTDQTVDWFLKMKIENLGSAPVRLDSIGLQFIVGGIERSDYTVNIPGPFWGSGNNTLPGGAIDSLLIRIDITGHDPGTAVVQTLIILTNTATGGTLSDHALTTLMVQIPANLVIREIRPSTQEVTKGQEENWTVTVVINNSGGSEVTLDSSAASTGISLSLEGAGWQIIRPDSLIGGGWTLSEKETDYLVYTFERTGDVGPGTCLIHASVAGVENNTGRPVSYASQAGEEATVLIEDPAHLLILKVENLAPNAPYINTGQNFSIRVTVENSGGDGIHDGLVHLLSDGLSVFPPTPSSLNSMSGGEIKTIELAGIANGMPNNQEIFTARAEGKADNTERLILNEISINDTTKAVIQYPANLFVEGIFTSVSEAIGGQVDPWTIKVAVINLGQASIALDPPVADDISFWTEGLFQSDYKVLPPASLMGGGVTLSGGAKDTLVYRVTATGRLGGTVEVRALIKGKDKNVENILTGTGTTSINILAERAFRIISTRIHTLNRTDAGNGYVNTGQNFQVVVVVENGLGESVENVEVKLESNGGSLFNPDTGVIPRLTLASWDSVKFNVQANLVENLTGETFTAILMGATLENSGLSAPLGAALDSTAFAIIQSPAHLYLTLELSNPQGLFSTNQKFNLKVLLHNIGSGEVDHSGRVRVELPSNYQLDSTTPSDIASIKPDSDVEWIIKAPGVPQPSRDIYVTLFPSPNEKNTGYPAEVEEATVSIGVTTLQSTLNATLSISLPDGAIDGVLSTGQSFVVKATVQSSNVTNITATIVLPYSFTTADNLEKSVISDEVLWQVHAPNEVRSYNEIQVSAKGVDALQENVVVQGNVVLMAVSTVQKANLSLNLSIISPLDAVDRIVSLGQAFLMSAFVENIGEADTMGITRVSLNPLTNGYHTNDPLLKDIVNGTASWTVIAPTQPTGEVVSIEAQISTVPQDENTNKEAFVSRGNHSIGVATEGAWLAISTIPLSSSVGSSVVPGSKSIKLMVLELDNRGLAGASPIVVSDLALRVEDRLNEAIPPNTVLSEISVVNAEDPTTIYGWITNILETNPVNVHFSVPLTVSTDRNQQIAILGKIAVGATASFFQLNLPSEDYVNARDFRSGISVPVRDVLDEELEDLRSDPKRIFHPGTEATFRNVPNPFGEPGKELTSVIYYLRENTDVTFRIYTLTGGLVWSTSFTENEPQGGEGIHSTGSSAVTWDGRNGRGLRVLNGVYILVMETGYGEVEKTKIAVVK